MWGTTDWCLESVHSKFTKNPDLQKDLVTHSALHTVYDKKRGGANCKLIKTNTLWLSKHSFQLAVIYKQSLLFSTVHLESKMNKSEKNVCGLR